MPRKLAHGEPPDINGACNARLHLGDNNRDSHTTFICQLNPCHDELHQERTLRVDEKGTIGHVTVSWDIDEGPRYADCRCDCGYSDVVSWYTCQHSWKNGECPDCGITRAEHDAKAEERKMGKS